MKAQTFITKLETENGKMLDFERWAYKRQSTVETKAIGLHKRMMQHGWYAEDNEEGKYISIYDTSGDRDILIKKIAV